MRSAKAYVGALIKFAMEGEARAYEETMERFHGDHPVKFKAFAEVIELQTQIDDLWNVFNSQPGGTDAEVDELVTKVRSVIEESRGTR